jgi:tRNA (guanine-N7-)-methyltransferase
MASSTSSKRKKAIKPYHKIKAHANPLSDYSFEYPSSPDDVDWSKHYTSFFSSKPSEIVKDKEDNDNTMQVIKPAVEFADVGCGYGGLIVSLSPMFPENLILGLEIRDKVTQYVEDRIQKLRDKEPGKYTNISVVRTNCMKYLPNYFKKGQLKKIFFTFPDPHFKKSNHKRRIISPTLLSEYAYILQEGGLAYTITDVEELHVWMVKHFTAHPLFERVPDDDIMSDPVVSVIMHGTEEARKVSKSDGKKFPAVFRKIARPTG